MNPEIEIETLKIVSAYSNDSGIAFVTLELIELEEEQGFEKVRLLEIWDKSPGQDDFFPALKSQKPATDTQEFVVYIFNGESTTEGPRNPLLDKAKAYGLESVQYADPFRYEEGKTILESLEVENHLMATEAPGWPKLAAQLERNGIQQSPTVWAFLQAAIYADKEISKGGRPYSDESISGYAPREDDFFGSKGVTRIGGREFWEV